MLWLLLKGLGGCCLKVCAPLSLLGFVVLEGLGLETISLSKRGNSLF